MNCTGCGRANRDGARFCGGCGATLAPRCPSCGTECEADARFCDACGTSLAASEIGVRSGFAQSGNPDLTPISDGARKVVSIIFADLAGSTALHERLDAESARHFMEGYYRAMRGAVERQGGKVAKLLGDGVMAVFGIPLVAEDDAIRAVRAAVDMQRVFRELAEWHSGLVGKVGLRVAVNTGEVVAKDETELIGDPVNVAARLQDQARDGDVVIGESTRRLVASLVTLEPLGSLSLKGRAEAVGAYRVVSLERPASATTSAFVGRDEELARITAVQRAAVNTPAARLAVLLGSPGLGKSRLIDEFVRRAGDDATVITAHCDATGGATFAPIAMALREFLGVDSAAGDEALRAALDNALAADVAERVRVLDGVAALLAGSPAAPEETFFVVRRLLASLSAVKPVVLVIDDLHWAAPLLLDLVEHLVQWGAGVPLLVLVGARPELRDARSSLAAPGPLVTDVVTLGGLDAGAAMRLAANVIGATDLPAAVAAKVLAASEGNPLFVGELVRMLVHEGALLREGDRWTIGAGLAALEMPPTIHALLAARIERLKPEERIVLERAAVVGRHFSRSALNELLPRDATGLDARLESLRRSELIEPDTGWFLGEPVLRFHHGLIRDAAYRRLLKGTRAELHGRLADWIEAQAGDSVDHDETIGWHLEQAHQHLGELGPLDAAGRALGARASSRLAAAGKRALARDDLPLAAGLLGRSLDGLNRDDATRAELAIDWCEALLAAGSVGPGSEAVDELGRFTADSPRLRAWHTCFAGQLSALNAPQSLQATAEAVAVAAEELARLDDAAGEAKAHSVHAQALARLGKVGACESALDKALAAARRVGDRRRANAVLSGAPQAALWGPSPVTRASGRCLDVVRVLRITQGAPAVEAVALSCQGVLEALRGRTDAARRMVAASRKMVEELGIIHRLLEADVCAGRIDLLEGDAVAAERCLRGAYEGLRDLGLGSDAAQAGALLARAMLAQGRAADAEALSYESETLAGDDLQAAIAWRGVRAEALAQRGEHKAAVELAEAAVAIASATDALLDHADARLALAAALRAAGRSSEAASEEKRAYELWDAKGATLLAGRARGAASVEGSVVAPAYVPATRTPGDDGSVQRPGRRAPGANDATALVARIDAAVIARDAEAIRATHHESYKEIDHPTGSTYGIDGAVTSVRKLLRSENPRYFHEVLATLGDRTVLTRREVGAQATGSPNFDVGEYSQETLSIQVSDGHGHGVHQEVFAIDRMTHAIERFYELYAGTLPEGAQRSVAEATARSIRALRDPYDVDRLSAAFAPDVEVIDHRIVGFAPLRGSDVVRTTVASFNALVEDASWQMEEILDCRHDALLSRSVNRGRDLTNGGQFERPLCVLTCFDTDGRLARWEYFEPEDVAAALARFDELSETAATTAGPVRRVRPNAAFQATLRVEAAFTTGDVAALNVAFADSLVCIDHPTGATYGREGQLDTIHRFLRSCDPKIHFEALATLGSSLYLRRRTMSASGTGGGQFDVGEYARDEFALARTNDQGQQAYIETFADDHLGDAFVRLFELYAAELADGPARLCAETTARSVGALLHGVDPERFAAAFAPNAVTIDHRKVNFGTLHGPKEPAAALAAFLELTKDVSWNLVDILDCRENAVVIRASNVGKEKLGGGAFERRICQLLLFDEQGLISRCEIFEDEDAASSLARLDALLGEFDSEIHVEHEAAAAWLRDLRAGFHVRDWDGLTRRCSPAFVGHDHRLVSWGFLEGPAPWANTLKLVADLAPDAVMRIERAESCPHGILLVGSWLGTRDGGAFDSAYVVVFCFDEQGRPERIDVYDPDKLEQARARLDEIRTPTFDPAMTASVANDAAREDFADRHLRSDASRVPTIAADTLAARTVNRLRKAFETQDWPAIRAMGAPDFTYEDRGKRVLVSGDIETWIASMQFMSSAQAQLRNDETIASFGERIVVERFEFLGGPDGDNFEMQRVRLLEVDADGFLRALIIFDDNDRALASLAGLERFAAGEDAATGGHGPYIAFARAMLRSDWGAIHELLAPDFEFVDHRVLGLGVLGRDRWIQSLRAQSDLSLKVAAEALRVVASHPHGLAVAVRVFGRILSGGEFENLLVFVCINDGNHVGRFEAFDIDDSDKAIARFEELCALREVAQNA